MFTAYATGADGGEPSIGWDPARGAAIYGADTKDVRLSWDAAGTMTATDVSAPTSATTLDAITVTDQRTARTFVSQLAAACSLMSYSDDAGATWNPTSGCGLGALLDHRASAADRSTPAHRSRR